MPAPVDLQAKRSTLARLPLDGLRLRGDLFREGGHLYIHAYCRYCGETRPYLAQNLERGATTRCRCRRAVKYDRDPLAKVVGYRYDAIKQRCEQRSNPLFSYYGGRGIRCDLSRQDFVEHVLELARRHRPVIRTQQQLRGYRIERIKDSKHFAEGNLRLAET